MVATLTGLQGSQSVILNLGTPGQSTGITQFRSSSTATAVAQNGRGAVVLPSAGVDNAWVVQPLFNNGKTIPLGQLAVTGFNDAKGPVARRNQSLQRFGRPWKNAWRIIGRIKRKRRNRVLSPDHRPTRVRANCASPYAGRLVGNAWFSKRQTRLPNGSVSVVPKIQVLSIFPFFPCAADLRLASRSGSS